MLEFLQGPIPWYISGVIMGLTVPAFLLFGNRQLGISANLRHMCAAVLPKKISFFNYEWKKDTWNLLFALGIAIGGFIGGVLLPNPDPVQISESTKAALVSMGVKDFSGIAPNDLFGWDALFTVRGIVMLVVSGFLIGFGTRWGRGCTSGHGIMGLSLRSPASFAAVCAFFSVGIITAWSIVPLILSL